MKAWKMLVSILLVLVFVAIASTVVLNIISFS